MAVDLGTVPSLRRWEKVLFVLLLFAFMKPLFFRAQSGSSFGILEYGVSGNIYLALLYGATLVLLLRRPRAVWRTLRADLLVWALVGLSTFSFLWSIEPYISFRAAIFLIATTIAGVVMAASCSNAEQVEVAAGALGLGAVMSVAAALVMPAYGIDDGNWLGVFLHKNYLGRYMALGAIVFALLAGVNGPWRRWAPVGLLLSALLVFLSGSSTAAVVLLLLAGVAPLFAAMGAHIHLAIAILSGAFLSAGLAVVFFLANQDAVLQAFSRDATLTGRTSLWPALVAITLLKPWLGYGFQAFWFVPESSEDVKVAAGWVGTSAHNGFLEIALALGLVGLALFVMGFLRSIVSAIRHLRRSQGLDALWPAVFLAFFLAYNLTETSVLLPNNVLWVLYVAVVFSLRRTFDRPERTQSRARRHEPAMARAARPVLGGSRAGAAAWQRPG